MWRIIHMIRVSHSFPSIPWFFLPPPMAPPPSPPPIPPPLKNEAPHLKSRAPFQKKKQNKSETVINTCASLIKQHWKKMAEIPQKFSLGVFKILSEKWNNLLKMLYYLINLLKLTNIWHRKISWFHFTSCVIKMPCFIKKFCDKPVE